MTNTVLLSSLLVALGCVAFLEGSRDLRPTNRCLALKCDFDCPSGYRRAMRNGCKICKCIPDSCKTMKCENHKYCVVEKLCDSGICVPTPVCKTICKQEVQRGPCNAYYPRYYYDSVARTCKRFIYGGCRGNKNNFRTLKDCRKVCVNCYHIKCSRRCPNGYLRNHNGCQTCSCKPTATCKTVRCLTNHYCVMERVCHRRDCTVKPVCKSICKQRVDPGQCRAKIPRYYYDTASKTCKKFIYGGCRGNKNNFRTLKDCRKVCVVCHPIKCWRICPNGYLRDHNGCQTCRCKPTGTCKTVRCLKNHYCVMERVCHGRVCTVKPVCKSICKQKVKPGPCKGSFLRYYYDSSTKTCKIFIYGGCQGNQNNFQSLKDCRKVCVVCPKIHCIKDCKYGYLNDKNGCPTCECRRPITCKTAKCLKNHYCVMENVCRHGVCVLQPVCKSICKQKVKPGPCKGSFPRYYYDKTMKTCKKFIYGGCQGNQNNFQSLDDCRKVCVVCPKIKCPNYCKYGYLKDKNGCPTCECKESPLCEKANCDKETEYCQIIYNKCRTRHCKGRAVCKSICVLPKQPGTCKGYFPRYYYDETTNKCVKFVYGGCNGNQNNFVSLKDCHKKCVNRCPRLHCKRHCRYGYIFDSNDCRTCRCHNPCSTVRCRKGYRCVAKPCSGYRCKSRGYCIPYKYIGHDVFSFTRD